MSGFGQNDEDKSDQCLVSQLGEARYTLSLYLVTAE